MALNAAPAAVRRPTVDITLGSASADDWRAALVGVRVDAALAPAVDRAELYVSPNADAPTAALGDAVSIAFGYADGNTAQVFSGQVIGMESHASGPTRIILANGGATLAALRVNQSYEQQSAGDIVRDLASRASITPGTVDTGPSLAFYVVDDRQSGYQHTATLARLCGFIANVAADGTLNFGAPMPGPAVQQFSFGVDVLAVRVTGTSPLVGSVSVVGEGAAGSQGTDAWAWLLNDPSSVTGTGGSGPPERLVVSSALRSNAAASGAATGAMAAFGRSQNIGRLLVAGASAVVVGSTIDLADMPQASLNGSGLVLSVQHRYGKQAGFLTQVTFSL
jgi:hypothetical protein